MRATAKRKRSSNGSETRSYAPQDEGSNHISQGNEGPRAAPATAWVKYQCPLLQGQHKEHNQKWPSEGYKIIVASSFASVMDRSFADTRTRVPSAARRYNLRAPVAVSNATTKNPTEKRAQPLGGMFSEDAA